MKATGQMRHAYPAHGEVAMELHDSQFDRLIADAMLADRHRLRRRLEYLRRHAAGGQSGEIQTHFAKTDWSNYTETGDYSFDPNRTSFTDWTRVTLYRNGVLVWGVEP